MCNRSVYMRSARERHLLVEQLLLKKPSYILPCRSVRSPQQINTTSAQRKVGLSAQTSSGLRKDTTLLLPSHSHTSRRPCRASITAPTNCSESIKTTCTKQLTNYISLKIWYTKSPTVQPGGGTVSHARTGLNTCRG